MTKDEALRMALRFITDVSTDSEVDVLNAIDEALEQPKEKKYLYVYHENGRPLHIETYRFANHMGYDYIGKIEVQDD